MLSIGVEPLLHKQLPQGYPYLYNWLPWLQRQQNRTNFGSETKDEADEAEEKGKAIAAKRGDFSNLKLQLGCAFLTQYVLALGGIFCFPVISRQEEGICSYGGERRRFPFPSGIL